MGEPTRFKSAAQRRVAVTSFWKLRRDQSAGRRRSTSSRGAEKDVKSTSRGEEFQVPSYRETIHCSLANGKACLELCIKIKVPVLDYTL